MYYFFSRTKLSYTPSVLQKKPARFASTSDDKTPLNNEDFRKMLLSSK